MSYSSIKQRILASVNTIGTENSTKRIRSNLITSQHSDTIKTPKLYVNGLDSESLPAFPGTVHSSSLVDVLPLGNLTTKTMFDVYVEFVSEVGDLLYVYHGKVVQGHHLKIVPNIKDEIYWIDETTTFEVDSVNQDIDTTIVVQYAIDVPSYDVSITWVTTDGTVLDTYVGRVREGANVTFWPSKIDGSKYDTTNASISVKATENVVHTIVVPKWCTVTILWKDDDNNQLLDSYTSKVIEGSLVEYIPKVDNTLYNVVAFSQIVTDNIDQTIYIEDRSVTVTVKLIDNYGNVVRQFDSTGDINTTKVFDVPDIDSTTSIVQPTYTVTYDKNVTNTFVVYKAVTKTITVYGTDELGNILLTNVVEVASSGTVSVSVPEKEGYRRTTAQIIVDYSYDSSTVVQVYNIIYTILINFTDDQGDLVSTQNVKAVLNETVTVYPENVDDFITHANEIPIKITQEVVDKRSVVVVAYGEVGDITLVLMGDDGTVLSSKKYEGVFGSKLSVDLIDFDGYKTIDKSVELEFNENNDKTTLEIVNYNKIYQITINAMYNLSADGTECQGPVSVDYDEDGIFDGIVTYETTALYGETIEFTVGEFEGFERKQEVCTITLDETVIADRTTAEQQVDVLTHIRLLYVQFDLCGDIGNSIIHSIEVPATYNETVTIEIPVLEGYRINSAFYNNDTQTYTTSGICTPSIDDNFVKCVKRVTVKGYCVDVLRASIGSFERLTNRHEDGSIDYTFVAWIWYNRGQTVERVMLEVNENNVAVATYMLEGDCGLLCVPLLTTNDENAQLTGNQYFFWFVDVNDSENGTGTRATIEDTLDEDHYISGPGAQDTCIKYVDNQGVCYGTVNLLDVPTSFSVRMDCISNKPRNLVCRPLDTTKSQIIDVTAIDGSLPTSSQHYHGTLVRGMQRYEDYTYGVFDLHATLNNITKIESESQRLVTVNGLKFRVSALGRTDFVLDEVTYNSNGTFNTSYDLSEWTELGDYYSGTKLDLTVNLPFYFIVFFGLDAKRENAVDSDFHLLSYYGLTQDEEYSAHWIANEASLMLNCPYGVYDRSESMLGISPISLFVENAYGIWNSNSIFNGTLLIPNLTTLMEPGLNVLIDRLSMTVDGDDIAICMNSDDPIYSNITMFDFDQTMTINVVGEVPQLDMVTVDIDVYNV